jgi:SnoaL-like polyketide cyclase
LNALVVRREFNLFADYFQFYLWDPEADPVPPVEWTDREVANRMHTSPHVVVVCPVRNMTVPVVLELHHSDPGLVLDDWDHVAECSLAVDSGQLELHECTGGSVAGVYEDFAARFRGVGPDQVKNFLRGVIQTQPDFNWQLTNAIVSGSIVAGEWTWTATFTADDPGGRRLVAKRVSGRGATVAVIENGQIKQLHDYYDDASFFPKASSSGHP